MYTRLTASEVRKLLIEKFSYRNEQLPTEETIRVKLNYLGENFWKSESWRFPDIKTFILNQDNGGENNSRRTQFMKRIVEFAHEYQLNIRLAYYPPYHSKYNPIERTWGILEKSGNGSILDEVETALNFAQNMTWKGKHPVIKLVTKTYQTGVKLTKKAMSEIERQIEHFPILHIKNFPI